MGNRFCLVNIFAAFEAILNSVFQDEVVIYSLSVITRCGISLEVYDGKRIGVIALAKQRNIYIIGFK